MLYYQPHKSDNEFGNHGYDYNKGIYETALVELQHAPRKVRNKILPVLNRIAQQLGIPVTRDINTVSAGDNTKPYLRKRITYFSPEQFNPDLQPLVIGLPQGLRHEPDTYKTKF